MIAVPKPGQPVAPAEPSPPAAPAAHASTRWPADPALTPAAIRAQSLPFRSEGDSAGPDSTSESTQLITMEPYRFEQKFRRRGSYLVLWVAVAAVVVAAVAVAVLLITRRISL